MRHQVFGLMNVPNGQRKDFQSSSCRRCSPLILQLSRHEVKAFFDALEEGLTKHEKTMLALIRAKMVSESVPNAISLEKMPQSHINS